MVTSRPANKRAEYAFMKNTGLWLEYNSSKQVHQETLLRVLYSSTIQISMRKSLKQSRSEHRFARTGRREETS